MNLTRVFFIAALILALSPFGARAQTPDPAKLQPGDTWTYDISMSSPERPISRFRQEYTLLWKSAKGNFVVGERRAQANQVWAPGKSFNPDQCLVFIVDPSETFDESFCRADLIAGYRTNKTTRFSSRITTYLGNQELATAAGTYATQHFSTEETFVEGNDDTAPTAKSRVWHFWYAPQARAFARVELSYLDATGSVVRNVNIDLKAVQLK